MNFLLIGKAGCLSGDTEVLLRRGKKRLGGKTYTLREAYHRLNHIHWYQPGKCFRWWNLDIDTDTLSYNEDEGFINYAPIESITYSGTKETFEVRSELDSIRATSDHKFLTPEGFTELRNLSLGDSILIRKADMYQGGKKRQQRPQSVCVKNHPTSRIKIVDGKYFYKRVEKSRLVYEAYMNGLSYEAYLYILNYDPEKMAYLEFLPDHVIIHHKDLNYRNNDPKNLEVVYSIEEHNKLHPDLRKNFGTLTAEIKKVTFIGNEKQEDTYDIQMRGPYHNFVVQNFIVHNSGKTTLACTFEHPTLLIDVDRKAHEMVNLQPLIKEGKLKIIPIKARLVSDTLRYRAEDPSRPPKKLPTGYLDCVDLLNEIVEDEEGKYAQYKTVVLDSLTRLSEHLKRLLIYHRGQGKFGRKVEDDMNWPSWGSYLSNLEELFSVMCSEQETKNFICTVHEKVMTEKQVTMAPDGSAVETEAVVGYKPLIEGQMRDKLVGYFNEAYYMAPKERKGAETEWKVLTRGPKYDARTSMKLDEFEDADLLEIVRKARNESKTK